MLPEFFAIIGNIGRLCNGYHVLILRAPWTLAPQSMLKKYRFLPFVLLFSFFSCFLVVESLASEFYRCVIDHEPPSFFQKDACQLLSDPTVPFQPTDLSEVSVSTELDRVQKPLTRVGSWIVTQILVPFGGSADLGWKKQAVINNRRVGIGAVVDGGRVREITRTFVVMAHTGGETLVPFDQETVAAFDFKPPLHVSLSEFGKRLPLLLQRLALGEEVLLVRDGQPLARLLPVPTAVIP